jgi:mono/diheme cytochrome c family protein
MKVVCTLIAVVLLLGAPIVLWSAEDGASLYEANCAMCHGDKGQGNPDMEMPKVTGTSLTAEQLVTYLTKGDKAKTVHAEPVAGVNEEQAKTVAAFVIGLKK